jgi:DNA topoisomerase-3
LPEDYRDKVRAVLNQIHSIPAYRDITARLIDGPWHNESSVFDDKAVKDHFAIIPTGNLLKSLPKDEGLLFDAVIRRLMAALMPAATIDQVERRTIVCGEVFLTGPEEFTRVLGWQEATMDTTTKRKSGLSLKPLKPDNDIHLASVTTSKEETKPPPRIGEAQLLSMMEHAGRQVSDPELARLLRQAGGLGTAATRAEIIENLKNKDYVYSNLQPTTKGLHLIRFLKLAKVEHLTSPQVTAELEQHLEMVESASRTRDSFIQEITRTVEVSLRAMTSFDLEQSFDHAPVIGTCPTCGNSVHERMWNYSCKSNRITGRGCGFTLPKDCHGRWLDPQSVARLLTSGPNGIILSGFPDSSRMQTPTRRKLALNEGRLTISDEAGTQINEVILPVTGKPGNLRRVTWGPCPIHVADGCLIVETKNAFICEMRLRHLKEGQTEAPGFQLPKSICQQRLKFEDIDSFIKKGKTRVIEGFKSRGGKLFNARVIRNAAGSWTFDFNPTA